ADRVAAVGDDGVELLAPGEGVVEGGVVLAPVDEHERPAVGGQGPGGRGADAAGGAGDDGGAAHGGAPVSAHQASRAALRSSTSASRSAAPSSALAPAGSPSTPFGDTDATPPARRSAISSVSGRGSPAAGGPASAPRR